MVGLSQKGLSMDIFVNQLNSIISDFRYLYLCNLNDALFRYLIFLILESIIIFIEIICSFLTSFIVIFYAVCANGHNVLHMN